MRRIAGVGVCCLLAAMIPFVAGLSTAFLGLVPLGLAIWLVARSEWSSRIRVATVLGVLVVTLALFVALLALALRSTSYN
jgi:hypothetical protein